MDEAERALAELEFLEHHKGGRRPTAAHPDCTCLANVNDVGKVARSVIRKVCPVHGRSTT